MTCLHLGLLVGLSVGKINQEVLAEFSRKFLKDCVGYRRYLDQELGIFHFNPFSPTLFLIVAKISLPKRSGPYSVTHPFLIF